MRNMVLVFSMTLFSACGFVAVQLQDKANEEKLLKPGTLDLPLTGVYDTYQFKLLDRYSVRHDFLRINGVRHDYIQFAR